MIHYFQREEEEDLTSPINSNQIRIITFNMKHEVIEYIHT